MLWREVTSYSLNTFSHLLGLEINLKYVPLKIQNEVSYHLLLFAKEKTAAQCVLFWDPLYV